MINYLKKGCVWMGIGLSAIQGLHAQDRQTIELNKDWQFVKGDYQPKDSSTTYEWQQVNIPHTWNNVDMQTGKDFYAGNALYKKTINAPAEWKDKQIFLRFEGVGQLTDVYVNNRLIGRHKGSYAAFVFDISYALRYDAPNTILVKVNNEPRKDIIPINNELFGIYGGIYRPAALVITPKTHIAITDQAGPGIYIRQQQVSAKKADITVTAKLDNHQLHTQPATLRTRMYDHAGKLVREQQQQLEVLPQGRQRVTAAFTVNAPHLWNGLKDPYLYKIVVSLLDNRQQLLDEVVQPLGIRKFEIKPGKGFYLNDQPYRLYGVCRHQDWWGYGNALDNRQHAQDLETIREMGANSIRFAHYQQADYIYAKCDSIGFVIWAEVPFVNRVSGEEGDNAKQQLSELIHQQFNHPSIYTWGMHNEVYGKTAGDYVTVLTAAMHELAKTLDPDRYTVSVTGYGTIERPENRQGDIQGMNRYYGWYEGETPDLEKWVSGLEKNYPQYKVVLSEYGAEGNVEQQAEILPPVQYNGQFFPESYETRSHETQWGIISRHPYLAASYLWNMFDFAVPLWSRGGVPARNMKGLVTFDRKIKKDVFYWYKANWSKEPVVYITERRLIHRKQAKTTIHVYDNIGRPEVSLNGVVLKNPRQGATSVHFIYEGVTLQQGKNTVKCISVKDGKTYTDTVEWILD